MVYMKMDYQWKGYIQMNDQWLDLFNDGISMVEFIKK